MATAVLSFFTAGISDDTVYYLSDSWASMHGETSGRFPMRLLAFRPLLLLGLPSANVLALANALACATCLFCGFKVSMLAQKIVNHRWISSVAGAWTALWLVHWCAMVYGQPDNASLLFLMTGVWLLAAPPGRLSTGTSTCLSFLMLTLAFCMGPRHWIFLPTAVLTLLAAPARRWGWALLGSAIGLLPSLLYLGLFDSWSNLVGYNWVLTQQYVNLRPSPPQFPTAILVLAVAGGVLLWRYGDRHAGRSAVLFWCAATAALFLVPLNQMPYVAAPWVAFSFVPIAYLLSASDRLAPKVSVVAVGIVVAVLTVPTWTGPRGLFNTPQSVRDRIQVERRQTDLIAWLSDMAQGGPVACVAPCHPIEATNTWTLYNAWLYCYLTNPSTLRRMNPTLVEDLKRARPRVIAWDAWPGISGTSNVLEFLVRRQFVPAGQVHALTRDLKLDYRLVRFANWSGPVPVWGDAQYLVRRDVALDERAQVLDQAIVDRAAQALAPHL